MQDGADSSVLPSDWTQLSLSSQQGSSIVVSEFTTDVSTAQAAPSMSLGSLANTDIEDTQHPAEPTLSQIMSAMQDCTTTLTMQIDYPH